MTRLRALRPRCRRRVRTRDRAPSATSPAALHDRDVAALQQRLGALGEPVDDLLLAGLGAAEVEPLGTPASMPKSDASLRSCAGPRRSGGAPWPGCSPGAGTSRRPGPPPRARCSARRRRRTARWRSRPGHRRGPRCRIARPERPPPRASRSDATAPTVRHVRTPPFFQAEPRVRSFRSRRFTRPLPAPP